MSAKRVLFVLYLTSYLFLSGCWSSHEVSSLAISVCIGIDKTKNGYIVSEQIVNPRAIASNKATNESPVILYTAESESIIGAIESLDLQSSRNIYSAHLRMVVLSEELAKDGIEEILCYFMRSHEYRTDFNFIIAKGCMARDILSVLTPEESIPGVELYEKLKLASSENATAKEVKFIELANSMLSEGINPVITGALIIGENGLPSSTEDLWQTPGLDKIRYTGLGAFSEDKLVGWLSEAESKGLNLISGNVNRFAAQSDIGSTQVLTFDVHNVKSEVKAFVKNGEPSIDVNIDFDYRIIKYTGDMDLNAPECIPMLNGMAQVEVLSFCNAAVNKTQNELKTDVFGFGERIHTADPEYWKTVKGKWNKVYPGIPVNITVTAHIKSTGECADSLSRKNKS